MFVYEFECFYLHLLLLLVIFDRIQFCQLAHPFQYIEGEFLARIHTFEPTPATVRRLKVEKMSEGDFSLPRCPVHIEQEREALFLFRLAASLQYPRCFL